MHDAFVNEDATPVLLPSASQATIGSKANNLSFGTQLVSSRKSNQPLDLIEFNIGNYGGVSRSHAIPLEDAMNGNDLDSPVSNELLNNCAFIVPMESMRSPSHLELTCPPPGDGDVSQCTNSNFCKIQNLIDYFWEKIPNVNVLAVCRNKPLIAYVLDPNYSRNVKIHSKGGNDSRDYSSQVVRFVNYEKPSERALSRTTFTSPIADIAFAFKSIREGSEDKLAAIDKNAVINVFGFRYVFDGSDEQKLVVEKLFEIISTDPLKSFEHLHLKWCPFVPLDDDYEKGIDSGMSLAVSCDSLVEVFAVDKICNLGGLERVTRSELHQLKGVYQRIPDAHKAPITAVHLSNDATVICTAAVDNSVKFFDLGNSDGRLLHNWSPSTVQDDDQISCFYFLDDYNYLLENSRHHFWAYLFIGTKGGNISIWDLGGWSLIQNLSIECESSSKESHFEYKIDISAKVIIAVRGENAFVFLLDFIQLDSENKREEDGVTTYPRITKIGRFQLYSDILSFVIKRQSTQKLDIFWVSRKSLERCSIDVEQMKEKRSDSPVMRLGNMSAKFDDEIEVLDSSIKKLTPLVKELSGKKKTPISTPPSIKLAEMFNKPSPVTPLNTS
ncbi:enhancer of mRNA-decapping protein 4-like protein, partial [Leptotrombidium deliense]